MTGTDDANAALVNLVVVLADNTHALGRRLAEWCVGPPTLEGSVAAAAIAQQLLGQARLLYPLLDELPAPEFALPEERVGHRRAYHMTCLDREWPSWPLAAVTLLLVDAARTVVLESLRASGYERLATRVARLLGDAWLHRQFAEGRVRELVTVYPSARRPVQDAVTGVFPEVLCWLGPDGEPGVTAMRDAGLADGDNAAWRRRFLDRVGPVLAQAGVAIPDPGDGGTPAQPWAGWDRLHRRRETPAVPGVACPWCGSDDVERIAPYGSQLLADQYRCTRCHGFFGRIHDR